MAEELRDCVTAWVRVKGIVAEEVTFRVEVSSFERVSPDVVCESDRVDDGRTVGDEVRDADVVGVLSNDSHHTPHLLIIVIPEEILERGVRSIGRPLLSVGTSND